MKTIRTLVLASIIFPLAPAFGQSVGINTDGSSPDASAMLDVSSTTKGLLIPRMTDSERTAISSPAIGLMVYDTTESIIYFYTGSKWQRLDAVAVGDDSSDVPTSPYTGQLYLDTSNSSDNKLYIYTSGGQWAEIDLTVGAIY